MNVLDDPDREFAASPFLRLEVLPRAIFNNRAAETAFYEAFFSTVTHWATDLDAITGIAMREASANGIEAMDALHVAGGSLGRRCRADHDRKAFTFDPSRTRSPRSHDPFRRVRVGSRFR